MAIKSKLTGSGIAPSAANNIVGTVANNLTAAGTNQATAYAMSLDDIQVFTTVSSSTGCIFQPGTGSNATPYQAGDSVTIANHGAQALSVYPATGGKIANGSANAAFSVSATKTATFTSIDGTSWMGDVSA